MMRKIISLLLLLVMVSFIGCINPAKTPVTQSDTSSPTPSTSNQAVSSPTPVINKQDNTQDGMAQEKYYFDASKEWDAREYEKMHGQKLDYFAAPIYSPYLYTYQCESKDMTIEEVALALGTVMMNDLMRDYEGKTFTVTEYQNLTALVMDETETAEWEHRYNKAGKKVVLQENQWLCTFDCEYKYTGVYGNLGEMPTDWEWKRGMDLDGSGEDFVFIIQKVKDDEYIMRGLPKTIMEIKEE